MDRIQEFWYCVAAQDDLPLYKGHVIASEVCENLIKFIQHYREQKQHEKPIHEIISTALIDTPLMINDIRLLLGISDKRLYLDLTYLVNITTFDRGKRLVNESRENLLKHNTKFFITQLKTSTYKIHLAELIATYFINKGIEEILDTFSEIDLAHITPIFNNLIAPKEIQQKQAKYRGHGAEMTFAKVCYECGVKFVPESKHKDPMGQYDPNVDLSNMTIVAKDISNFSVHSFDLVIKDANGDVRVLIQSLIHSSDPGQYGVDKSNETIAIKDLIDQYNELHPQKPVYLLGCVDGVGFSENPKGTIGKMIDVFDDFFQMHTLFKIPLFLYKIGLMSELRGLVFDRDFFEPYACKHFEQVYLEPLGAKNLSDENIEAARVIDAGKGTIVLGIKY
ncbi:MAG: hypothetical protein ACRCTE_13335 [Cellulosilyticaceae bacterium]